MILQYVFNTGIQYFVWVLPKSLEMTLGTATYTDSDIPNSLQ